MFESEMRIEVERRLQKACDDRARSGLPPPVSIDAYRAIVRSDLLDEIEAKRLAQKAAAVKQVSVATVPTRIVAPKPVPPPAPRSTPPAPKLSAMELLAKYTEGMDLCEPVLPSLRNPANKPAPKPVVDMDEVAARAMINAAQKARGG